MTSRTTRIAVVLALLPFAVLTGGCLVKETDHVLSLETDGSVRWTVLERNIRATGDNAASRQREEDEFLAKVRAGRHKAAIAFRALGGADVRTDVVSPDWPMSVRTEARFADLARLWQSYFETLEMPATSVLTRDGDRTVWRLEVDVDTDRFGEESEAAEAVGSLLDDDPQLLFGIRRGHFTEAVGFTIDDDGRTARMEKLSKRDWNKEPRLVLSLTWVAADAVGGRQGR